jgi:hypothetical protein
MDPQTSILLYSKYSSHCQKLTNIINESGLQLPLHHLCIDNDEIRKRIKKCTKLKIVYVPCILIIHNDGGIEQFDGDNVFTLVTNIIKSMTPQPSPIPLINEVQTEIVEKPSPKQKNRKKTNTPKVELITSLEDLPSDDEDDDEEYEEGYEDDTNPKPPIKGLRMDAGNEEYDETAFQDPQPQNRDPGGKKGVRESASNKHVKSSSGDVNSMAQNLAKERENDDKKFKNRGPGMPSESRRN